MRLSVPSGITLESIHAISVWYGTSLWRKRIDRSGSSPEATNIARRS